MKELYKKLSHNIYEKFHKRLPLLIFITPILGIIITIVIMMGVAYFAFKNNYYHQKEIITRNFQENLKKVTKQRVELAYNVIEAIYKSNSGKPNQRELTIKLMQQILDKMRWGKKGYVFVIDFHGNTLYHPNKKFMKINRWNLERGGVKVIQLLAKSAMAHPEGTYVKYLAYNPTGKRPLLKVSYVKVFKPLKFFIGSGVYLDSLDKRLLKQQKENEELFKDLASKLLKGAFVISVFMIVIMGFIAFTVKRIFEKYENELQEEKAFLFDKATHDRLTGLYNREAFIEFLKEALKEGKEVAVLFIDLDGFKEINDTLGHDYGDKILKEVAKRLENVIRDEGKISRFGGDEFVILIEDKSRHKIEKIAKDILDAIKKPFVLNGKNYHLTASIGISVAPFDSGTYDELLKNADTAMYKVKQAGKNRFTFFTEEMSKEAKERVYLRNLVHQLLKNDAFVPYFQPQMDKNDRLCGSEVLLRARDSDGNIISPFKIIPMAIELGIIEEIDLQIMRKAIKQYKEWEAKGYKPGVISCNVTMYELEREDFVKELKKMLREFDFDPKNLNIEITEESIMKKPEFSIKTLKKIAKLGIEINIDDFGTGYSSLSHLKKLPVSKLKIDRSFIKDIPYDKDDIIITKSIITLAKSLNLKVIAEGVETKIQRDFVFENGCDLAQGYYYSPPLKAEEFEKRFLKR